MEQKVSRIGKYELVNQVGSGGFGIVYKAYDPSLDRSVALKILHPQFSLDAPTLERFRTEARQTARLKHPNIITVFEVGEFEGRHYIAMEYVEGSDLRKLIAEQGSMNASELQDIIIQVAGALDYAHAQGLIHRDIKPSNILVDGKGHVTLTDFGIVKVAGEPGLSTTGVTPGTPEYMSPEQVQGQKLDSRTDLYSFGVVTYHAITGKVPFTGTSAFSTQLGHVEDEPPDPREINPAVGERVAAFLLASLSKDPDDRFQTGAAFARAFQEAAAFEEDRFWEDSYQQALELKAAHHYTEALEKFDLIQNIKPGFKDVEGQIELLQAKIQRIQEYNRLTGIYEQLETEARQLYESDPELVDGGKLFSRLGIFVQGKGAAHQINLNDFEENNLSHAGNLVKETSSDANLPQTISKLDVNFYSIIGVIGICFAIFLFMLGLFSWEGGTGFVLIMLSILVVSASIISLVYSFQQRNK